MNLKKQLKSLEDILGDYEDNKVAFTKSQLSDLYKERRELIKEIKRTCKHDHSQLYVFDETDSGYGTDRTYWYWRVRCLDCKEHLVTLRKRDYLESAQPSPVMPIIQLVRTHPGMFAHVDVEKFGIKRITKTAKPIVEYFELVR